jgi:hypothetical protein
MLPGKLAELRNELDQKENDLASQRQRQDLAAKYQERLRHLQDEIKGLKKRQKEYAQLERENRDRCREIQSLQGQINEMKRQKVGLQKKQAEDGAQFREWKASRLREITQLRREARRTALEHHKLLQEHTKQNAILKRRTEEVWAVQKKMRETEASRRLRNVARTGAGGGGGGGGPREAWGEPGKGGGLTDAAADKILEHELAVRLKEKSGARELERAVRERAELAARRDAAKERRDLLLLEVREAKAGGGEEVKAELREIEDEAESLEAQARRRRPRAISVRSPPLCAPAAISPRSPRDLPRAARGQVGADRRDRAGGGRQPVGQRRGVERGGRRRGLR